MSPFPPLLSISPSHILFPVWFFCHTLFSFPSPLYPFCFFFPLYNSSSPFLSASFAQSIILTLLSQPPPVPVQFYQLSPCFSLKPVAIAFSNDKFKFMSLFLPLFFFFFLLVTGAVNHKDNTPALMRSCDLVGRSVLVHLQHKYIHKGAKEHQH